MNFKLIGRKLSQPKVRNENLLLLYFCPEGWAGIFCFSGVGTCCGLACNANYNAIYDIDNWPS